MQKNHNTYDIAVLGGGPSGSLAAIGALQVNPNLRVCIVDPVVAKRHRIGEALLTGTIMTLRAAGLDKVVADCGYHRKIGASYLWGDGDKPWYVNYDATSDDGAEYSDYFSDPNSRWSIHVPRHHYDALLLGQAVGAGAEHISATVVDVAHANDEILNASLSNGAHITAKQWIDTTGQGALLGKTLGVRKRFGTPKSVRYTYVRNIDWGSAEANGFDMHRTNILSSKNGWIWIIHLGGLGEDVTSLGFVSNPTIAKSLTASNTCELFPELSLFGLNGDLCMMDYLGRPYGRFYSHPHYSFTSSKIHGKNWSLAGDAAMFVDPILSQGVSLASHYGFERGRAAASSLETGDMIEQANISSQYIIEGRILKKVCEFWYSTDPSVDSWQTMASQYAASIYKEPMDRASSFRWITNLENLHHPLHPYSPSQWGNIMDNLS